MRRVLTDSSLASHLAEVDNTIVSIRPLIGTGHKRQFKFRNPSPAMTTASSTLSAIPQEVLEHIAFFSTNDTLLGPPSGLIPLLLISRSIYSCLYSNHHLYARIYAVKFDVGPAIRRIGFHNTVSSVLAAELHNRFRIMKRIRDRLHCLLDDGDEDKDEDERDGYLMSHDLISLAYYMMLENEGKNERQLRDYAKIDPWLRDYWFHERGASRVANYLSLEGWLPETPSRSMAMWLFWFLMRPGEYLMFHQSMTHEDLVQRLLRRL